MINFGPFQFASLPRTGTRWFVEAAVACGFSPHGHSNGYTDAYMPPPADHNGLVVSIVRHPLSWLASYHAANKVDAVPDLTELRDTPAHDVYAMKGAIQLVKMIGREKNCDNLDFYVRTFANETNGLWRLHTAYQANVVLKLEDFPWCVIELFESLTDKSCEHLVRLPPFNCLPRGPVDPELRKLIVASEPEYCGRYNYW